MINKKILIATALSAVLFIGNTVNAESNDLLRMDLKKSSSEDTVDVTFYTTGGATNSVVTRKSGNSYVVLLPNVAGNQSVVPSLGGVKDLVSDITVKNVDDGIGGYTKVTFNTTKPVKIQTYTKKTAPLTKAQQDYKNLIAQNNKISPDKKAENFKKTNSTTSTQANNVKNVNNTTNTKTTQPAVNKTTTAQKNSTNKTTNEQNKISLKPVSAHTPVLKPETTKTTAPKQLKTETKNTNTQIEKSKTTEKSVQKPDVKEAVGVSAATKPVSDIKNSAKEIKDVNLKQNNNIAKSDKKIKVNNERKSLPIIPIAGILSVIGIFILGGLINIISRAIGSNSNKLKEYLENYSSAQKTNNTEDYQKIIDDDNLTWQEKYKLYSEKQQDSVSENSANMSYIAGMDNTKGVIVPDDMKTRISQMEHSLAQTPKMTPPENISKDVQSEDNSISKTMSDVKLKSFAKNINLKETSRNSSIKTSDNVTEPLKEGKYVKLRPSALSMSRRNLGDKGFNISELLRKGRKYLNQYNSEPKANIEQEPYILSSLNEYLDIIDSEKSVSKNETEQISTLIPQQKRSMMGITNPMSKMESPFKSSDENSDFNGVTVKSKYDIDDEKSIFMVDSDGVSALIGKIGENIFVLKKFDKIINKPLQVRLDYGNVYIVKAGGFKCLVDVSENKMGTLLEI